MRKLGLILEGFVAMETVKILVQECPFTPTNADPRRLWTDKGTEYNQQLKAVLAANNVTLYSTENEE